MREFEERWKREDDARWRALVYKSIGDWIADFNTGHHFFGGGQALLEHLELLASTLPGANRKATTATYTDAAGMDAECMPFEEWRENWSICDGMLET